MLNLIKIGLGIVFNMNLNIFFILFRRDSQRNTEIHKKSYEDVLMNRLMLFFNILELKFISNPRG